MTLNKITIPSFSIPLPSATHVPLVLLIIASFFLGNFVSKFQSLDKPGSSNQVAQVVAPQPQQQQVAAVPNAPSQAGSCGSSGGCGCGGGAKKAQVPQGPAVAADQQGDTQVIKTSYTLSNDIQPNNFTVKAGVPVRMEIEVKESGSGCMSTIMIPGLVDQPQPLIQGQNITFNFTPQKTGNLPITCAMGVPRGTIQVI